MYLISMPQDSVCVCAHTVSVCASMFENGAFIDKKYLYVCRYIYCLVKEINLFLFHQMIFLTVVNKLLNRSRIHAFYIFSSWNFIAHLSSEKQSRKQISNRQFSKAALTLKGTFCVYIFLCFVLYCSDSARDHAES